MPKSEGTALEVRAENQNLQRLEYSLDRSAKPEPLPDAVLAPEDAVRRLWDLAPTVRFDQVYVQLLRPGAERADGAAANSEPATEPLPSFLGSFPVRMRDQDADVPKGRLVWRMLAVRDRKVVIDRAYGTYIYIDAVTGAPLSKREPAVGFQIYTRHKLIPPSPIAEFVFPNGEIPLDSLAEQVGTFESLAVAQKAESLCLGLRALIRDGRSDDDIRAALDKMDSWWERVDAVRRDDAERGLTVLQEAAQHDPKDIACQVTLLKRLVDEIGREKKVALASPVVTEIGNGRKSEFWFDRQFETTPEALGTRNQKVLAIDPSNAAAQEGLK